MRSKVLNRVIAGILTTAMLFTSVNIDALAYESAGNDIANSSAASENHSITVNSNYNETDMPGTAMGYIDAGINYERVPNRVIFDNEYDKAVTIPSSYSSVDKGFVTSIKDQNPWGTCWAFAAVAAMESYALSHGLVDNPEDINLSEFALAYLTFNDEKMLYDKTGDYSYIDNMDTAFDAGGNDEMVYKSLSNGLALYDDDEVQYTESQDEYTVPDILWDKDNISYVLTGQKYINIRDTEQVKAAIMENGAVTTAYYSDYAYTNQTYGYYLYNYNYEYSGTNHAVAIVGWDDNMDKNLFAVNDGTTTHIPSQNGAWLIKNSWSTYFGNQGYIWISYEDMGILSADAVVYEIAPVENYPILYQHDSATVAYNSTYGKRFANVFQVEGEEQIINAISFFTRSTDMEYTVYLYDNSDGSSLDEGELVCASSGAVTYVGYYTVEFDNEYKFKAGDIFTVIVEFEETGYMLYASANQNLANKGTAYSTCLPGQSYIERYSGYGFTDITELGSYMNISIKAHAKPSDSSSVTTKITGGKLTDKNQVTVSWDEVEGAVSYELWKSNSYTGESYKVITDITGTSYTDTSIPDSDNILDKVEHGKTYYYKVKPILQGDVEGAYSNIKTVDVIPEKTEVSVSLNEDKKIDLNWSKVSYADGYEIRIGQYSQSYMTTVATVGANVTSYTAAVDINVKYYIAVVPYVTDSLETKHYGTYSAITKTITIGTASYVESNYYIEDTVYLSWQWDTYDLLDGFEIDMYCNDDFVGSVVLGIESNTYLLDISEYEPGDEIELHFYSYAYDSDSFINWNSCFELSVTVAETFTEEVYWYVHNNQVYAIMPVTTASSYYIYYDYNETEAKFDNYITVSAEEMESGYALPTSYFPLAGEKVGVIAYGENQVVPKELIMLGGTYAEPILSIIQDTRATSSTTGVELSAHITNKVPGCYYQYQWYESDTEDGTATAISGATDCTYTAYVADDSVKYYYCQVTCWYNGQKTCSTTNEVGKRTKISGSQYYGEITIADIQSQIYTGSPIKPAVIVKDSTTTLTLGTDYTVTYGNNINAGIGIVNITFVGDYSSLGTVTENFTINPVDVSSLIMDSINSQQYTGSEIKPSVTLKYGSITLTEGTDYAVVYSDNVSAGTATLNITCKGNYIGTISKTFIIVPAQASDLTVGSIGNQTYIGSEIKPAVTVKYGSITLTEGTDYAVEYSNNISAGTATVAIVLKGNYAGALTKTFTISQKSIGELDIASISNQIYTGSAIKPSITIKNGSITLRPDFDYTLSYSSNINVGNVTVSINGIGNYTGTVTKTFAIVPLSCETFTVNGISSSYTYTGSNIIPTVTVNNGSTSLVNGIDYTVTYSNNKNAGTATVTIVFKGNYTGTIVKSFTIARKSVQSATIAAIANQIYTGSAITPAVTVTYGGKTLVKGTDYTVAYSNNIQCGTGVATITGIGNYKDELSATFSITDIPSKLTSGKLSVADASNYISKISVGTSVASLISQFNESKYAAIYKGTTKITGTTLIGTGMLACIMNGNSIGKKYTLIVTGDTNGDGKINITDMIAVKAHILKKSTLTDVYAKAGDVNADGKINITDLIKVKATLLGKDTISGVAVK